MRLIQDSIDAKAMDTQTLFSGSERLVMPPYQRSYSWSEQDALNLLSDLRQANESGNFHFIGAVVVIQSENSALDFEIVDGQQRLTTLTMILCVLRDLSQNQDFVEDLQDLVSFSNHGENLWRLNLNQTDGPFFRTHVQLPQHQDSPAPDDDLSDSQRRIISNYDALFAVLKKAPAIERKMLVETVKVRCQLVRVIVNTREDGYKVFRVLNTRGREPNAHDIIKTDLLEQARLPRDRANQIAEQWTEYEAQLGNSGFDSLLRQIRMLYDKSARGSFVTGFRKSVLHDTSAAEFLENRLPRYVLAFDALSRAEVSYGESSTEIMQCIHHLSMLEHQGWQAPALKFLFQDSASPASALAFFKGLSRLATVFQLIVHDRDQRTKRYRHVLGAVNANTNFDKKEAQSLALSVDEVKRLRQRLNGRFATFRQRRAMAFLLNAIMPKGQHLSPEADATVEHILPRNPAKGSIWADVWPDMRVRRELCDSLGNLALLTHQTNQFVDRKEYTDKKAIIFADGGDSSGFGLTADIRDIEVWTPEIVRTRTERLSACLLDYWGI